MVNKLISVFFFFLHQLTLLIYVMSILFFPFHLSVIEDISLNLGDVHFVSVTSVLVSLIFPS